MFRLKRFVNRLFNLSQTGRLTVRLKKVVLKVFSSEEEARREYSALIKLNRATANNKKYFLMPKPIDLIKKKRTEYVLVATRLRGHRLRDYLLTLAFTEPNETTFTIFRKLGSGLRTFHNLPMNCQKTFLRPTSGQEIFSSTVNLAEELTRLRSFDRNLVENIKKIKIPKIDSQLTRNATLHGEFYFTHVMIIDNSEFGLVDFTEVCNGPAYYDLATFNYSLYRSLMPISLEVRKLLAKEFLKGYFKEFSKELLFSVRLTELYVIVYLASKFLRNTGNSWSSQLIADLWIKKLIKAVRGIILPELIAGSKD